MEKKYILKAYYTECSGKRTLASFVVTNPVKVADGIWATSRTAWGGTSRNFYRACDVVSLTREEV